MKAAGLRVQHAAGKCLRHRHGRRAYGAGTIVSSKYCYKSGKKTDKDDTDITVGWLCDREKDPEASSSGGSGGGGGGESTEEFRNLQLR